MLGAASQAALKAPFWPQRRGRAHPGLLGHVPKLPYYCADHWRVMVLSPDTLACVVWLMVLQFWCACLISTSSVRQMLKVVFISQVLGRGARPYTPSWLQWGAEQLHAHSALTPHLLRRAASLQLCSGPHVCLLPTQADSLHADSGMLVLKVRNDSAGCCTTLQNLWWLRLQVPAQTRPRAPCPHLKMHT